MALWNSQTACSLGPPKPPASDHCVLDPKAHPPMDPDVRIDHVATQKKRFFSKKAFYAMDEALLSDHHLSRKGQTSDEEVPSLPRKGSVWLGMASGVMCLTAIFFLASYNVIPRCVTLPGIVSLSSSTSHPIHVESGGWNLASHMPLPGPLGDLAPTAARPTSTGMSRACSVQS